MAVITSTVPGYVGVRNHPPYLFHFHWSLASTIDSNYLISLLVLLFLLLLGWVSKEKFNTWSFQIGYGMKFDRNVLQLNMRQSDFSFDITFFKVAAMTSFHKEKWVNKASACAYAAASNSS